MTNSYQMIIFLFISSSFYFANGNFRRVFIPPEEDTILFHLGSHLKSLGIPDVWATESHDRKSGSWYIGYGENRYFRIGFERSPEGYKLLSGIDFNLLNLKGTFKKKPNEFGHRNQGGIRIDDPFHGGNKLLELEGLFQSEDPNCDRCLDNATMNIKITPEREFFGLELSLVSSFKSETHHKFLRLPFIPFHMRWKKFEASMKIVIPHNEEEIHGFITDMEGFPSGATADFQLKFNVDIPEHLQNGGTKKPGYYIFSASAKVTKFGYSLTKMRHFEEGRYNGMDKHKMVLRIDAKDDIEFENQTLNYKSIFNNLDKSFSFDGIVNTDAISCVLNMNRCLQPENKLFEMKLTDMNRGIDFGKLEALFSKDHIKIELDSSLFDGFIFLGGSKVSFNVRKSMTRTSSSIQLYFETNEIWTDEWPLAPSDSRLKPNECNKYMIYDRQIFAEGFNGPFSIKKVITHVHIEPLFAFFPCAIGRYERRNHSLIFKEEIVFNPESTNRTIAMTTTFADAISSIHYWWSERRQRRSGGVEIETLFQFYNYDSLKTSIQANVTRLCPYPSSSGNIDRSQLGYVDISFDEPLKTCSGKMFMNDGRANEEKIVDVTFFNFAYVDLVNQLIGDYTDKSLASVLGMYRWFPIGLQSITN